MFALLLLAQAAPAPVTPPAPAPAAAPAPGAAWRLTERTSTAGVRSVSAAVVGVDGLSRFVVKCDVAQEPIVSVQFLQPSPIGQSEKPVAVRFDNGLANSFMWQSAGNGAYVSDPDAVTRLTTLLVKAKTVAVETTNASDFAVQASFAAPGGDAMIRKVLSACGYTLGVVPPVPEAPKAAQ